MSARPLRPRYVIGPREKTLPHSGVLPPAPPPAPSGAVDLGYGLEVEFDLGDTDDFRVTLTQRQQYDEAHDVVSLDPDAFRALVEQAKKRGIIT